MAAQTISSHIWWASGLLQVETPKLTPLLPLLLASKGKTFRRSTMYSAFLDVLPAYDPLPHLMTQRLLQLHCIRRRLYNLSKVLYTGGSFSVNAFVCLTSVQRTPTEGTYSSCLYSRIAFISVSLCRLSHGPCTKPSKDLLAEAPASAYSCMQDEGLAL